jgi:tRNA dimethylallyltransferase
VISREIDARFEEMFSEAGIAEVRRLIERDYPASAPVMRAIGVREIAAWLRGAMDRDAALEAGKAATRQYAKRQYTWFRHQPPADWPRMTAPLDCQSLPDALARFGVEGAR